MRLLIFKKRLGTEIVTYIYRFFLNYKNNFIQNFIFHKFFLLISFKTYFIYKI